MYSNFNRQLFAAVDLVTQWSPTNDAFGRVKVKLAQRTLWLYINVKHVLKALYLKQWIEEFSTEEIDFFLKTLDTFRNQLNP